LVGFLTQKFAVRFSGLGLQQLSRRDFFECVARQLITLPEFVDCYCDGSAVLSVCVQVRMGRANRTANCSLLQKI